MDEVRAKLGQIFEQYQSAQEANDLSEVLRILDQIEFDAVMLRDYIREVIDGKPT